MSSSLLFIKYKEARLLLLYNTVLYSRVLLLFVSFVEVTMTIGFLNTNFCITVNKWFQNQINSLFMKTVFL